MHLPSWINKIIMSVLVVALLLPGLYLAVTPQAPAEAQWFNTTVFDVTAIVNFIKQIGDKIMEIAKIAFDVALYKTVKYAVRMLGDQGAQWVGRQVSGGRVGQEPLFWEQSPQQMIEQAGEAAGGFFIEGLAEGMATEEEMQKSGEPQDRAMKSKRGAILQRAQQIVNQLCNPDPRFRFDLLAGMVGNFSLKFGLPIPPLGLPPLGLIGGLTKKTEKPACTFTQAYSNWKKVATEISTQAYEKLKGAIDTVSNFPKALADAFEKDKRDIADAIDRIGRMGGRLANDPVLEEKKKALLASITKKLAVPTDLNTINLANFQKTLNELTANLRGLPDDSDVKANLEAMRARIKEIAPDSTYQPKLDALKTYVDNDVPTTRDARAPLKRIYDAITSIDDPYIIDRLRDMQGLAQNDHSESEFNAPLAFLLQSEEFNVRASFNRSEETIKNTINNPKIRLLIGNAQGAAGQQQQADMENAKRRATGNLTGWQVMVDLTDPGKASDMSVKSKTESTMNDFLSQMREAATLQRTENSGVRPVTTLSGQVTSPPFTVASMVSSSIAGQVNQEGKFTGNAVVDAADLIGEFADSIFAKSGQMIMEGFTKTNPDQPIAQQNKIEEMVKALGTGGEAQDQAASDFSVSGVIGGGGGGAGQVGMQCPREGCPLGMVCDSATNTCQLTGTGSRCTGDGQCTSPLRCVNGTCQPPTELVYNSNKCPATPCPSGFVCDLNTGSCVSPDQTFITTRIPPPGTTTQPPSDTTTQPPSDTTTQPPSDTTTQPPSDTTTQPPSGTTTQPPSGTTTQPPSGTTTQPPPDEWDSNIGDISNPNANVTLSPSSELITNPAANPDIVRRASIQARIAKLVALPPSKEEQMNILGMLSSDCIPGSPDSCTILPAFAQSIQQQLTVAESVARFKQTGGTSGIDENTIFGFKRGMAGQGVEPDRSQGLPYSSMVILRKYRIIPVSWEIAALYIRDHSGLCGMRDCTLGDALRNYSNTASPFYKLIDPNWVLKAPGVKCMLQGYGPPIEQMGAGEESTNENAQWICRGDPNEDRGSEGTPPNVTAKQCKVEYKIQPRAQICLDQQTCLDQDAKGRCKGYGYCLEEKKRWQFAGTECRKQYSSCLSFTNTETNITISLMRDSLASFGYGTTCSQNNAGCSWHSKALVKKDSTADGSQRSQYKWDETQKVYFTNATKNLSCTPDAEGCSKLSLQSTGADTYVKVAPSFYGCSQNLTGADSTNPVGYKKDICKGFALHCPASYAGCASYVPVDGDPPVSGISPIACDAACVGLARFTQVPTQLETPERLSYDFIPSTAQSCSADQAGCDEFTNLEGGASGGGEQRDYYSSIVRCVKKLFSPEDQRAARQDVFYSWTGSETGGAQLEKFLFVSSDDAAKSPVCWRNPAGSSSCDCNAALNGPGRPLCRQFFRLNSDGSPSTTQSWWRIQDDLVHVTDSSDCVQYRRTLDGASSPNRYYISQSNSALCSAEAAGCREYHSTHAGNMTALLPDTFSDAEAGSWTAGPADGANVSVSATKEGETLGDYSLKAVNNDTSKGAFSIQKKVALRTGSVLIGFAVKGPAGASINAQLYESPNADARLVAGEAQLAKTAASSAVSDQLDGSWQYFQFAMPNVALALGSVPALRITLSKGTASALPQLYLDDITVRQSDGFIFAIKESWQGKAPAQCYVAKSSSTTEKDWNTGKADQLSCQTYTDAAGTQMTFQRFTALCPREMVGCAAFSSGSATLSLVNDPKKYCRQQDAKCTAYGQPQFDTKKSVISYRNVYYKILPGEINPANPDYGKGICKWEEAECQDYSTKYSHAYFKQPGASIARWRAAKDEEKDQYPAGVWYYLTCGTGGTQCVSDSQCSGGTRCNAEVKASMKCEGTTRACTSDSGCENGARCILANVAGLCPSSQSTCSKVADPECVAPVAEIPDYLALRSNYGRTSGTTTSGIACQREYYYLDDVYAATGQCTGTVNVEKGCLLFQADYPSDGAGAKVPPRYDTDTIYKAGGTDLNAQNQREDAKDANVLAKVKLDRSCKTWLSCTDELVDATGHRTCIERRPCLELDENGGCVNFADLDAKQSMPQLNAVFSFDGQNPYTRGKTMFTSLSGLSRPNVRIKGLPASVDSRITPHDGFFDWKGTTHKIDAVIDSTFGVRGLAKDLPAVCRSHPQKDAPSEQRGTTNVPLDPINQCDYRRDGNLYKGLEGFCLENYPKKGYEKYCLNWYPTDKPAGALPAFDDSASGEGARAYAAGNPQPVNYCIKQTAVHLFNAESWESSQPVNGYCSSNDGTTCSKHEECISLGKGRCEQSSLIQTGTVTPPVRVLAFNMMVKKDGSNTCPAWGITGNTSYSCSLWTSRTCTTLGSTNQCQDTSANYCSVAARGCTNDSHNLCNTVKNNSTECLEANTVTENGIYKLYTDSKHPCGGDWKAPPVRWVPNECLPYNEGSVCVGQNYCTTAHSTCNNWGYPYQNGQSCTNYNVTVYGNCVESSWSCSNKPPGSASTPVTDNCTAGSWNGTTPPSKGTCTIQGGTCVANPNAVKMSCNVFNRSQTENNSVLPITSGNINPENITIKDAAGNPVTHSIPLTEANIREIQYKFNNGSAINTIASSSQNRWAWSAFANLRTGSGNRMADGDIQNLYIPNKTCNTGDSWFMITPYFGNGGGGELQGFKYALCADARSNDVNYAIEATIIFKSQNYRSYRLMRQKRLTEDYCTEFAQAVDATGQAIPITPLRSAFVPPDLDALAVPVDTSKPYSFGNRKEVINQTEWRVVTPGSLPSSFTVGSTRVTDSNLSGAESVATHAVPPHNDIAVSVFPLRTVNNGLSKYFAKIYRFFTLNTDPSSLRYADSSTSASSPPTTVGSYWNATISSISDYPSISSRRCKQTAGDGSEVMCSLTKICPLGEADCSERRDNSFILTFPRESAAQQIATMQFFAWTQASKTPLRRLDILWGDSGWRNIYNTVYSGSNPVGDNKDGFVGKMTDSKKEFTFVHTYTTTFWRKAANAEGTDICVFVQDNWYFWKRVCGRFKKGASGFVELDTAYNTRGFVGGWKIENGKGAFGPAQPGP